MDNLGDWKQALAYFRQALPIRREVGDRAGEADTLTTIGLALDNLGDWQQALTYYQQAIPIWREVGDRAGEAVTLTTIGLALDNNSATGSRPSPTTNRPFPSGGRSATAPAKRPPSTTSR